MILHEGTSVCAPRLTDLCVFGEDHSQSKKHRHYAKDAY